MNVYKLRFSICAALCIGLLALAYGCVSGKKNMANTNYDDTEQFHRLSMVGSDPGLLIAACDKRGIEYSNENNTIVFKIKVSTNANVLVSYVTYEIKYENNKILSFKSRVLNTGP